MTYLGDPILFQKSKKVREIVDNDELASFLEQMIATLISAKGVGLSAPQVLRSERIFIIDTTPNDRYPNVYFEKMKVDRMIVINPQIHSRSSQMVKEWEGCLSIPHLRGYVPRNEEIEVEYFDERGNHYERCLKGFTARVFQHEWDHLQGLFFIDRIESTKDLISEAMWYEKIKKENVK